MTRDVDANALELRTEWIGRVTTGVLVKTDGEESLVVVESMDIIDRGMDLLYAEF